MKHTAGTKHVAIPPAVAISTIRCLADDRHVAVKELIVSARLESHVRHVLETSERLLHRNKASINRRNGVSDLIKDATGLVYREQLAGTLPRTADVCS